jgi:hypothetical protein
MRLDFWRRDSEGNPVFYRDKLEAWLADEPERLQTALTDPNSLDLLVWNVFASLDTHRDPDYLAYRLQVLGGERMRSPWRLSVWTGRTREPTLRPSPGYVEWMREQAQQDGGDGSDAVSFAGPIEVPVRVESPEVLLFVETALDEYPAGSGGGDRLLELVDAGLVQADRVGKTLALGLVYLSGTAGASALSARLDALREPGRLAKELPHRERVPELVLRELSWQHLLVLWHQEEAYIKLSGQPVKAFDEHLHARGLVELP